MKLTHKEVSFIKSGFRIVGFVILPIQPSISLLIGVVFLILAEVLGIVEELV